MPPTYTHDAFGRLIVDPDRLPHRERIAVLRGLVGRLKADESLEISWLARGIDGWLAHGGNLETTLGLKPPRGSHCTAHRLVRAEQCERLLLKLATECGSDRRALRVLNGLEPCPASAASMVAELNALGAPRSAAAISRARASRRRG